MTTTKETGFDHSDKVEDEDDVEGEEEAPKSTKKKSRKKPKPAAEPSGSEKTFLYDPKDLQLVTDPDHPLFDPRVNLPIDEHMVANIMANGVLQPVIIRKNPETGETEVVAGRQRVKNTIEANKRLAKSGYETIKIPCRLRREDDVGLMGIMASENEARRATSPMQRAKLVQRMIAAGRTEAEVGVQLCVSVTTIKNLTALLDCTADVKKAVDGGKLKITEAYKLSKLEPDAQRETVAKMIEAGASASTKHERSRKMREVAEDAGTARKAPGKKQIVEYREAVKAECDDEDFKKIALSVLDWVLGKKGQPRFTRVAAAAE